MAVLGGVVLAASTAAILVARSNGCAYTEADVDIAVFAEKGLSPADVADFRAVQKDVEATEGIEATFFRTPEEALAEFETAYRENEAVQNALPPGGYEPSDFPASLRIVVADGADAEKLADKIPHSAVTDEVRVAKSSSSGAAELLLPESARSENICISD